MLERIALAEPDTHPVNAARLHDYQVYRLTLFKNYLSSIASGYQFTPDMSNMCFSCIRLLVYQATYITSLLHRDDRNNRKETG